MLVNERVKHIHEWERRGANSFENEERGCRNVLPENMDSFECDYCDFICKSKAGLVVHTKKLHEKSSNKKSFTCDKCNNVFDAHGNLVNHMRNCSGVAANNPHKKRCTCGKEVSSANFKRHQRSCGVAPPLVIPNQAGERTNCDMCGIQISKANLARHQRNNCPGRRVVL